MYDVLIIGCGSSGAAAAYMLARYELRVGILERSNERITISHDVITRAPSWHF